ncbi:hypothetical protein BJ912DRAFT_856244 [Pholiota molesta]|nr:hypothetical protein BJ912DRAFT_856244 [Pholiota molesta]
MGAPYFPPPPLGPNGFDAYGPPPALPAVNGAPPVPQIAPPVPVPLSPISFPLDATRYYLLGQLEYYLSPQNMAQDFFLRQRMDARGWIPISLIASFNRVKQLTMDVQFVKDVLTLSSLVQVRGSMVRMGGWERFVLPDAAPSSVEDQPLPHAKSAGASHMDEEDDDEDEEEDVVFVMGHEVGSWSPERGS